MHDREALLEGLFTGAGMMRTDAGAAYRDHLTGLPNRRLLDRALDSMTAGSTPFALLFIDLDGFKVVNDTRGHLCGDRILEMFASILRKTFRETDTVCRFGGDEFVVLAGIEKESDAEILAARLTSRTAELLGGEWGVTASTGLVFFPVDAADKRGLLAAADRAMYSAKASGRSRWCRPGTAARQIRWTDCAFVDRADETAGIFPILSGGPPSKLVVVRGEPGVGKTALVEEALRRSGLSDRCIGLVCRPEFADLHYAPLIGALRKAAGAFGIPELPAGWARVLGTVLPDVFVGFGEMEGPLEKVALLEAVVALLTRWRPVVIVAEDAQWIDRGTEAFLSYLLHFSGDSGIPVLCTFQTEAGGRTGPVGLLGSRAAVDLDLEPLSRRHVDALSEASLGGLPVSDELSEKVFRVSGGNPLFALEYLRALCESRGIVLDRTVRLAEGHGDGPLPSKVRELISSKLSRLEPSEMTVLSAASLIVGSFDPPILAWATGLGEGEVVTSLDRAARIGILVQDPSDPLVFSFRNDAYRAAIAGSARPEEARRTNISLASRYDAGGMPERAALCFERAGERTASADSWMAAGRRAVAKRLAGEAAACFGKAVEMLRGLPAGQVDRGRLLECMNGLHQALLGTGEIERAKAACLEAAELAGGLGRGGDEIALLSLAGDLDRIAGRTADALAVQLSLEPRASGENLFRILLRALDAASRLGRSAEAGRLAGSVTSLWRSLRRGRSDLDAQYYHKMVLYHMSGMDIEAGRRSLRRAISSPHPEEMDWFLHNDMGETLVLLSKPVRAIREFECAADAAAALPNLWGQASSWIGLASALIRRLELDRAEDLLAEACAFFERASDDSSASRARILLGWAALVRGNPDRAGILVEEGLSLSEQASADYFRSLVASAKGLRSEALDRARAAAGRILESGRSLLPESGILLTPPDYVVQLHRAAMDADVPGAEEDLRAVVPTLSGTALAAAKAILAAALHGRGMEREAGAMFAEAASDPGIREEKAVLHAIYSTWGTWDPAAARKARRLAGL